VKNENKIKYYVAIFTISLKKSLNFELKLKFFLPHFDFDFGLVALFKLVVFNIYKGSKNLSPFNFKSLLRC